MSELQFQYPWLLALLALLPLYAWLRGRAGQPAALALPSAEIVSGVSLLARSRAGALLATLRLAALALVIVALAGPRFARHRTESQASGIDIALVFDLSWSMMALDMSAPGERVTRFDVAQEVIGDFIRRRPHDRLGLVVFSGVPYLASPLTLNHEWLAQNVARLRIGMIRELGTAIGDATATAVKRLQAIPGAKSRIIILLTDGDNNKGDLDPVPAAELAAALRMKVYAIGIGRPEPCQLPAFDPNTGRITLDSNGEVQYTMPLNPANYDVLDRMAALTGGRSYRAVNRRELANIYQEIDRLERTEVKLRRLTTYEPLFHWPLLAATALLALEFLLAATRYRRIP
jgi:Ca-activated chloride channel family protein